MFKIKDINLVLELENGILPLKFKDKTITAGYEQYIFLHEDRGVNAAVYITKEDNICTGSISVKINNHPILENFNLTEKMPIKISITFDEIPVSLCAAYMCRDWWSRPAFIKSFKEIPEKTQALFLEGKNSYGFLMPMVGEKMKAFISGEASNSILFELTAYTAGISNVNDVFFISSEGSDLYKAIEEGFKKACELKKIPMKKDRKYPKMFDYFGWCSWDAFYTDVSEEKLLEKVNEIKEKQLPIRWLLIDDGWLNIKDQGLTDFRPDTEKFPNEFQCLTKTIKNESNIKWVGVWHALGGYWNGIHPESKLASDLRQYMYETKNGKLIPHYDPDKGFGFWRNFYTYLKNQGIDFVKVDGQSALKNYYKNNVEIAKAAAGTHMALEAAVSLFMNGNIINCMGMAMENLLSRPLSCISRNSDDFVPKDEENFTEHLLQNAYNGLYHDNVYVCDFDMFWTNHPDVKRHALLRAISGGPVYCSDPIGESECEEIMPLVYNDGRLLRMDRCAKPTMDCIFNSPLESGILKLTNTYNGTGAVAVFHLGKDSGAVNTEISPSDIYDLDGEVFGAYLWFEGKYIQVKKDERIKVNINNDGYALVLFVPVEDLITPIGLTNKYICTHPIVSSISENNKKKIILKEGGIFAFHSKVDPKYVIVNGFDLTDKLIKEDNLYKIDLSEYKNEISIHIE